MSRAHLQLSACNVAGNFDINVYSGNQLEVPNLFGGFEGKVALVTGGSIGIGRMIAEGLAVNGAKVYISSRKTDACETTASELNALVQARTAIDGWSGGKGGSVVPLPADLSTFEGCVAVADELKKRESKLHILVNNAGATWGGSFDEYPDNAWQKVMDLNVRSLFNLTQV
jgi:NAD(P)-dependent dehydrogenase (short-subunit alcohol dehydrogenase family)